tara:strand:+ start:149 stop:517 length:369 start_codon:yes stop_codon:yes gene_type:complete
MKMPIAITYFKNGCFCFFNLKINIIIILKNKNIPSGLIITASPTERNDKNMNLVFEKNNTNVITITKIKRESVPPRSEFSKSLGSTAKMTKPIREYFELKNFLDKKYSGNIVKLDIKTVRNF